MTHRSSWWPALAKLQQTWRALCGDAGGNVLMLTSGAIMMLMLATGFAVDYARAVQTRTRLNAAADAAALVSVTPAMFNQSNQDAENAARAMFTSRAAGLHDVTITNLTITAPRTTSSISSTSRLATVTWTATVKTMFAGFLGKDTLTITGKAVANAAQPPSIDFYVLLDNSPSMLLPTTSTGISLLRNVNSGCAFSCHINSLQHGGVKDSAGSIVLLDNTYYDAGTTQAAGVYRYNNTTKQVFDAHNNLIGTNGSVNATSGGNAYQTLTFTRTNKTTASISTYPADPFWLAQNYGKLFGTPDRIRMRIDDELTAAQDLIDTARFTASQLSSASHTVTYQMQFYTLNYEAHALTSGLNNVNNIDRNSLIPSNGTLASFMLANGWFPKNSDPKTSPGVYTNNSDSAPYAALTQMNGILPNPGTGAPNSTPQKVMIIVTDGFQDEMINGSQIRQQWNAVTQAQCTAIKNRGIRIAILYTVYDPATILPQQPGYAAKIPHILPALRTCASGTSGGGSLVYSVSADQDISVALSSLFAMTVETARLVQ